MEPGSLAVVVISVLGVLAASGTAWFGVPHVLRRRAERRLGAACRRDGLVVLSYDDGPGQELSPRLLDLLARHGARATFFLLGRNVERAPGIVRRMIDEGHEVGTHTHDHTNAWKAGPLRAARDLETGRHVGMRFGADPFLFRPPFGKITLGTLLHCRLKGLRLGWWTLDSGDTARAGPPAAEDIVERLRTEGGGVVLLHDFDREGERDAARLRTDYVLDVTHRILAMAAREGLRVVPLGTVRL